MHETVTTATDHPSKLNFYWRLCATGFSFLTFTLMGLAFRVCVCPWLNFTTRRQRERELRARRIVRTSFQGFVRLMCTLGVLDFTIRGDTSRLNREGLLLCAAHPTLIDVVLLMSMIDNANCIVKATLKKSFALSSPVMTTGYITNDSGPELVAACAESLAAGDTLIIFPEGTRSRPGKEPHLHHGAAAAALSARKPITPVRITCTPPSLMKGIPWYRIPSRKMHFEITFGEDIDIAPFCETERELGRPIAVRRLTQEIKSRIFSPQPPTS